MNDRSALRRSPRRKYHVEVESETVRDVRLSYRTLGILTYCLDQHESWQVRSEQLARGEGREGRDAIRKALHQLARCGYYRLERRRFCDGKTVMGAAISEYPVEQWARDYQVFGEDLTIPVVEQQDGSWKVRYPDDSLGPDGITDSSEPDTPGNTADSEPIPDRAPASEPDADASSAKKAERPLPPAARASAARNRGPAASRTTQRKHGPATSRDTEKKQSDGTAGRKPDKPKEKDPAAALATWYYAHATEHLGPYAGAKKSGWYFGLVKLSSQALEAGYDQRQVARAFQRTGVHFPNAPQFQRALSDERNNIPMNDRHRGRPVLYSDTATWGVTADNDPPVPASAPASDAVFGVVPA
ncbi:hypothetical protein ACIQCR_17205 [Streptomyces sp. NPDC093249]|uniref:hypothetical protein n=1 Tax=unclassified Streptomyces TaxID=2593676 RepID=UPI003821ABEC